MRICYNVTIEDVVAFNRYHFEHSRASRWNRIGCIWALAFFLLCFTVGIISATEDPLFFAAGFLAAGVFTALCLAFLMSRVLRWSFDRQVHKMFKEDRTRQCSALRSWN